MKHKDIIYKIIGYGGIASLVLMFKGFIDSFGMHLLFKLHHETVIHSLLSVGDFLFFFMVIMCFFISYGTTRETKIMSFLVPGFSILVSYIIKIISQIPRPRLSTIMSLDDLSFPSTHSTIIFGVCTLVLLTNKNSNKWKHWYLVLLSIMICFSRWYGGVHYLSDVIFGAWLGIVIAKIIYWSTLKIVENRRLYYERLELQYVNENE